METTTAPTPILTRQTQRKVHTWKTNYNNKMSCDWIVHIDLAPSTLPLRSWMQEAIIEIRTEDQSHSPIERKMEDLLIIELQELNDFMSYPSHAMGAIKLINHFYEAYPGRMHPKTKMAVYFYKPTFDEQTIDQIYKTN